MRRGTAIGYAMGTVSGDRRDRTTGQGAGHGVRLLASVAKRLAEPTGARDTPSLFLEAVCRDMGWEFGAVWLLDDEGRSLRCAHLWRDEDPDLDGFERQTMELILAPGEGMPGKAVREGRPIVVLDLVGERAFLRGDAASRAGLRAGLALPLVRDGDAIGALEFVARDPLQPDESLLDALTAIALQVGGALERRTATQERRRLQATANALFEWALDAVIMADEHGRIVELNPAAERTFGYAREAAIGRSVADLVVPPGLRERHLAAFERHLSTGEATILDRPAQLTAMRADGSEFPVELVVTRVDVEGPPLFAAHISDVTARRDAERRLEFLAYHDRLTGLPGRALFEDVLEMSVARARAQDLAVAVIVLDVDGFRVVNDSLGHTGGDELLRLVAARLGGVGPDIDFLARPGGDQFLVLLADLERGPDGTAGAGRALAVAEHVVSRIQDLLREPFEIEGTELFATLSAGISVLPGDATGMRELLAHAEDAMYRSKRLGPGRHVAFPSGAERPGATLPLATRLRRAAEEHPWVVHYQPLFELATGRTVGVEALLRWRDAERGLIPPGEFIPLAEDLGLIEPIGDWLLGELTRQLADWASRNLPLAASINVSPHQLRNPRFADKVLASVASASLEPSRLVVEITEWAAMMDESLTLAHLEALREAGVRVAIDDFGTGYSSLARLRELPADIIKIDRSFLRDVPAATEAATLVEAIIRLAHGLGKEALAEGIESEAQREFLLTRGCRYGQGYYLARPVPSDDIPRIAAAAAPSAPGRARPADQPEP